MTGHKTKLSPWYNARPRGVQPNLIVVHGTEGTDAGDLSYMTDPKHNARVSYHYLILRDGTVWQLVPDTHRAWHAGVSAWGGKKGCNDFSIGIGFSNKKGEPYTPEQYEAGGRLTASLMVKYGLSLGDVVGHYHVSPDRKTDPWITFQWGLFFQHVTAAL